MSTVQAEHPNESEFRATKETPENINLVGIRVPARVKKVIGNFDLASFVPSVRHISSEYYSGKHTLKNKNEWNTVYHVEWDDPNYEDNFVATMVFPPVTDDDILDPVEFEHEPVVSVAPEAQSQSKAEQCVVANASPVALNKTDAQIELIQASHVTQDKIPKGEDNLA